MTMPFRKSAFAGHPNLQTDAFAWQSARNDIDQVIIIRYGDPLPEGYINSARASLLETEAGISALVAHMKRDAIRDEWASGIVVEFYLRELATTVTDAELRAQVELAATRYIIALTRPPLPEGWEPWPDT